MRGLVSATSARPFGACDVHPPSRRPLARGGAIQERFYVCPAKPWQSSDVQDRQLATLDESRNRPGRYPQHLGNLLAGQN